MKKIYTGQLARNKHYETLASFDKDKCIYTCNLGSAGYWYDAEDEVWVAFDNEDGHCWVEEFRTEEAAKAWAEGKDKKFWAHDRLT